jgi:(E)-4-hydroxy-3-methylbut-2-enyl-diphosphate synthase
VIAVERRTTVAVDVGGVTIGGDAPIVVQSMTNTDTADVDSTFEQARLLAEAGSEIVRVTVNNDAAALAVPDIVERLRDAGHDTPIVGDFHYNGHLLLTEHPAAAAALAKLRINPGNVGTKHRDANFTQIVRVAIEHDKPVRIGVNWGSLDQRLLTELMDANAALAQPKEAQAVLMDALVESALRSAELAEEVGLGHDRIVISTKVSSVRELVTVYRLLAGRCDYPLHLDDRGACAAPPRRHRRHDPRLPHASAGRRPGGGGAGRPTDPAVAGHPSLRAAGHGVSRVWTHDEHLLPGDGRGHHLLHP